MNLIKLIQKVIRKEKVDLFELQLRFLVALQNYYKTIIDFFKLTKLNLSSGFT